ncbi:MAG: NAD+ synthase, partial [Candidatus Omnitrophica bacterium]|nr:NAD+ synthase [Candidatus Omnitrophota bacterium]
VYEFGDKKFTVNICEDIWTQDYLNILKNKKMDFIVNISASPFHLDKIKVRNRILSQAASRLKTFVLYCNLTGGQDELVFDGTSSVFSPEGNLISVAGRFREELLTFNLGRRKKYSSKKIKMSPEEEAFLALKKGLSDYVKKNGFSRVVVGVSGGIDSAVVLSIAKMSLGSSNVCALIMPSRYTSPQTLRDAKRLCKKLKVDYHTIEIDSIFEEYLKRLKKYFPRAGSDKTEENIQARIRGNLLMAFSNKFGYLVLNTGNKSELSCGYCTLYGDMVGGFGLLKDVPKTLIYKIAGYINRMRKLGLIPTSIIKRQPSAELNFNQKDTDSLPPYEVLDPILKLYIEEDLSLNSIVERGFNRATVKEVIQMVDFNEYKRRQAPIGIKITPKAFGKDRRMPITNGFSRE